ncbi:MAG: ABC transporter permease, partial [Actinomycetia bacterium]|nr:ABC transporter permease [Actinomycetes bacterium]
MRDTTWRIVADREISTRIRDKGFLGATGFMLLVVVAVFVVLQIVGGSATTYDVGVIDDSGKQVTKSASSIMEADGSDDSVSAKSFDTADEAEQAVRDGDIDVALLPADDGFEAVAEDEAEGALTAALSSAVAETAVAQNAQQQGGDLDALQVGSSLHERSLDPDADTSG